MYQICFSKKYSSVNRYQLDEKKRGFGYRLTVARYIVWMRKIVINIYLNVPNVIRYL